MPGIPARNYATAVTASVALAHVADVLRKIIESPPVARESVRAIVCMPVECSAPTRRMQIASGVRVRLHSIKMFTEMEIIGAGERTATLAQTRTRTCPAYRARNSNETTSVVRLRYP